MSLDSYKGKRVCICDDCGESLTKEDGKLFTFDRDEFDVFLERLNEAGWVGEKNKRDVWEHFCPDCQE